MAISSFITRRLANRREKSFSGFIVRLSVTASAISVAVMILALGFINGFQEKVAEKVFSFWGHVRVHGQTGGEGFTGEEIPFHYTDSIRKLATLSSDIVSVQPYAMKSALMKSDESMEGVMLKGVQSSYISERLHSFLRRTRQLSDTSIVSVYISEYTARQLKLDTGRKAYLYFLGLEGETPRVRPVYVAGVYSTGIEEYDKSFVVTELSFVQFMNRWTQDDVGGIEFELSNPDLDQTIAEQFYNELPLSLFATPVKKILPEIFDWLQLQNTNRQLIIVIMSIVAIINLISCLLILVLERTKMIGLLKALGATNRQVQNIFLYQGVLIATRGIIVGTIIGLFLAFLQQQFGIIRLDESAYYLSVAPIKIIWWQVVLVQVGTILFSFMVLMIPSLLVRTVRPVTALRFD